MERLIRDLPASLEADIPVHEASQGVFGSDLCGDAGGVELVGLVLGLGWELVQMRAKGRLNDLILILLTAAAIFVARFWKWVWSWFQ